MQKATDTAPAAGCSIRKAVYKDAPRCAEIHMQSWIFAYRDCVPTDVIEAVNARRPAKWEKLLRENKDTHYVIMADNRMIGFFVIVPPHDADLPPDTFELEGLYLDPDFIGRGYGKLAMEWIKEEIRKRGYRQIALWVLTENDRGKRFYKKNGFSPDGKVKKSGLGGTTEERWLCRLEVSA